MSIGMLGTFAHKLDVKGRIVLPARFREEMGKLVVATIVFEYCITVYPLPTWEVYQRTLVEQSYQSEAASHRRRIIMADANALDIDTAGRILIPQQLRERVGIEEEVRVIGNVDYIEIWNPSTLDEYRRRVPRESSSIKLDGGF